MKKPWAAYTGLTRAERNGIAILIIILLVLVAVRIWISFFAASSAPDPMQAQISSAWEHRQQPEAAATAVADTAIDINTADSMALVALDGIGARLAHRILERRQQLGSFKSYDDVWQVYHFSSAVREEILKKTKLITNSH
jgi:DNA uptake protein ComE-like DNA-binding protein